MTAFAVLATGLSFPEGPSIAADGSIWFSELKGGRLGCLSVNGDLRRYDVGGEPNGTAIAADGSIWFCDQAGNAVRRFDPASEEIATVIDAIDGRPLDAPNDLAFHPDGTLVFTCPGDSRRDPTGYVARRDPAGTITRLAEGLLFPNGVCFADDHSTVVVAETYGCRIRVGPWGPQVRLRTLVETPGPIGADGVAAGAAGEVFTCVHGAGSVRVARLGGGHFVDVAVPDAHPAGCAVDPHGRWDLVVTGTERGVLLGMSR